MVDINLLGGDDSNEQNYREEKFSQTINLDSELGTDTSGYRSDFSEIPPKSNNSRLLMILAGLAVVVVIVIWALLPSDENLESELQPITSLDSPATQGIDEPLSSEGSTSPAGTEAGQPSDINMPNKVESTTTFASLSPVQQQMVASTKLGCFTVSSLADALSGSAVFTLLRYSDDAFLAQFVTNSSSDAMVDQLRQSISPDRIQKESEEQVAAGRSGSQVIVSGTVSAQSAPVNLNTSVTELNQSEFNAWIDKTAADNGLRKINVTTNNSGSDSGYNLTLYQVNLKGSSRAALSFLDALDTLTPSVVIEKLLLINDDPSAQSSDQASLVMVLKHYGY